MTPIRRILVAVDASPLSLAAMDVAGELAGRLGAELEAVFVEDINVLRLVAHPFVHTFSLSAVRSDTRHDALIAKALELQVIAARRALERAVSERALRGSFNVRRGRVAAELLAAAAAADLVCLGWSGRAEPGGRPRLGSIARAVMAAAPRPVMVLRRPSAGRVVALWDGSESARRALAVAASLAARDGGEVGLLIPAAELEAEARALLAPTGISVSLVAVGRAPVLLASLPADCVLVVPAGAGLAAEQSPCSVVVVR